MNAPWHNKPIDTGAVLLAQVPRLSAYPALVRQGLLFALQKFVCEDRINEFLLNNAAMRDFHFINQLFSHLRIEYIAGDQDIYHIPPKGRVIIVANHPLGGLDGLALLRLIASVRLDVRIVVNELLLHINQLNNLLFPVDVMGGETKKADIYRIKQALYNDEAVIIFPAGEVSRAGAKGIHDRNWLPGFIRLAKSTRSPVLPIHIKARNSALFYAVSWLSQPLSMLMLPREMLGFKGKIKFTIGQPIAPGVIDGLPLSPKKQAQLVSVHLRRIGSGKPPLFSTQTQLIEKCDRRAIQAELDQAEILGQTCDNKKIFLFDSRPQSVVLEEIGRLRERTFRFVGQGTGQCKDLDEFDQYYRHLILWDDCDREIVGAYRLGEIWKWPHNESHLLYSATLFDYTEDAAGLFAAGLELGRSFVQPEYWGKRSLDYLWQGIGAYLARHPQVKYLFGPASLSQNLPKKARDLLICYYGHYYPDRQNLANAKTPYVCDADTGSLYAGQGNDDDSETAFTTLKLQLAFMGVKIPTLYKQYADLCLPGGTRFCGFNIDENFGHCVDGLIIVDLDQVKAKKRTRYIERYNMA